MRQISANDDVTEKEAQERCVKYWQMMTRLKKKETQERCAKYQQMMMRLGKKKPKIDKSNIGK